MNNFHLKNIMLILMATVLVGISGSSTDARLFSSIDKNIKVNDVSEKLEYINSCWWDNFSDDCLKSYIIRAIEYNHDLKKASWKSEEYRQLIKVNFAKELPTFSVSSSYLGINTPRINGANGIGQNAFILPFFMRYEADLLLKNHDKTKSALKTYEASKFEEKAAYISLVTNVATTYINLLRYDKTISLLEKLVKIDCEILKREKNKFNRGVISASQLNNAIQEVDDTQNKLDENLKIREKLLNQLATLIGDSAENSKCYKRSDIEFFEYKKTIPCEICSDKIFSRPDVLAAEKLLQKSKIDLKVTKKDFFPSFNIFGLYAFNTLGTGNFFSWQSTTAALVAAATQDIYKGGLKLANLRINRSKAEQALENYKQTDLIAIQEVNDSLYYLKKDINIDKQTRCKYNSEFDNFKRSTKRLNSGVISKTDFLITEKDLLNVSIEATNSKATRLIGYITLYKAVGGDL